MPGYVDVHNQRFAIEYEVGGAVLLYRAHTKPGQRSRLATLVPVDVGLYSISDPDPGDLDAIALARSVAMSAGFLTRLDV